MYSEELETLIDAALADGELTEKEKQVLFKRAQSEGIDLDEFEMILDGKLQKLKKTNQEKAESSAPKSNKFGDIKKCPSCGAIVQSYQGACPECGYAFEDISANSSAQKLMNKIDAILEETASRSDEALKQVHTSNANGGLLKTIFQHGANMTTTAMRSDSVSQSAKQRIQEVISSFPIPNTKSDLIEFIISMKTRSQRGDFASAYFTKYTECIEKAKLLFPNDKDFEPLISSYSKSGGLKRWWSNQSKLVKAIIIYGIIVGVFSLILFM